MQHKAKLRGAHCFHDSFNDVWFILTVGSGRGAGRAKRWGGTNSYKRLVFASTCRLVGGAAWRRFFRFLCFPSTLAFFSLSQLLLFAVQHLYQSDDCADVNHALHRCLPCVHVSGGWSLVLIGVGLNRAFRDCKTCLMPLKNLFWRSE